MESIGSSQELRLEICSNWSVDTIRKLLVLGAQTGPLSPGCRKDDARFLWMEAFRAPVVRALQFDWRGGGVV